MDILFDEWSLVILTRVIFLCINLTVSLDCLGRFLQLSSLCSKLCSMYMCFKFKTFLSLILLNTLTTNAMKVIFMETNNYYKWVLYEK